MDFSSIQDIIERYPEKMLGLYRKYGVYNRTPDEQTTVDLYLVYGEPFLMDLFNIHYSTESFLGALFSKKAVSTTPGIVGEKQEKGKLFNGFKNLFHKAAGFEKKQQGSELPEKKDSDEKPTDEKIMGLDKYLFYGLILVFIIILLFFLLDKDKKYAA